MEPILDRIGTDRSIVICPMIDAINDKTMEFSRQGGLAVGGFTWSLHFTWRGVPDHEQKRRKSEADPARYVHGFSVYDVSHTVLLTHFCLNLVSRFLIDFLFPLVPEENQYNLVPAKAGA